MTYNFLSPPNRFKSREFKELKKFSTRLIRSYRSRAKVFRRSSLQASMYTYTW